MLKGDLSFIGRAVLGKLGQTCTTTVEETRPDLSVAKEDVLLPLQEHRTSTLAKLSHQKLLALFYSSWERGLPSFCSIFNIPRKNPGTH